MLHALLLHSKTGHAMQQQQRAGATSALCTRLRLARRRDSSARSPAPLGRAASAGMARHRDGTAIRAGLAEGKGNPIPARHGEENPSPACQGARAGRASLFLHEQRGWKRSVACRARPWPRVPPRAAEGRRSAFWIRLCEARFRLAFRIAHSRRPAQEAAAASSSPGRGCSSGAAGVCFLRATRAQTHRALGTSAAGCESPARRRSPSRGGRRPRSAGGPGSGCRAGARRSAAPGDGALWR